MIQRISIAGAFGQLALAAMVVLVSAAISGCGGSYTEVTQVWRDIDYQEGPVKRVLVAAITAQETNRRAYEDEIGMLFQERGVFTLSSHRVLPPGEPDEAVIRPILEENDIDAVLVSSVVAVDKEQYWVQGTTQVIPRTYYDHFYGYYHQTYQTVNTPGYMATDTIVRLETNLYTVSDDGLIWSATTSTFNPTSPQEAVRSIGDTITKNLIEHQLIP